MVRKNESKNLTQAGTSTKPAPAPQKRVRSGPWRYTRRALWQVGVELLDAERGLLGCMTCGKRWCLSLRPGGRKYAGYWKCENGCNAPERGLARQLCDG